jgi:hypothetical protein
MWCTTRLYHQAAFESADIDDHYSSTRKDLRCSQITQSKEDTVKVIQAVYNFVNPFEVENKKEIYCLSSGTQRTGIKEVENDLLGANKTGQAAYMQFVRERLLARIVNFNDFIKELKLKTFTKIAQSKWQASQKDQTHHSKMERLLLVGHDRHKAQHQPRKSVSVSTWSCPVVSGNV